MEWIIPGVTIGLFVAVFSAFIANIVEGSRAVGSPDTWISVQPQVQTYILWGLVYTGLLMAVMGTYTFFDMTNTSWTISFILANLAFGTAFGAFAIAGIQRS